MANYRIDLAYDGGAFHGYARQPNVRTVQGDLESAIELVVGPIESVVAGRTDKGVHATGQVVSFTTEGDVECERLQRSLNSRLAPAIAVKALQPARPGFHARFSATGRVYRYRILNQVVPDPFLVHTSWHYPSPLDMDRMQDAGSLLVGLHDFASFCRSAPGRGTERAVRSLEWRQRDDAVKELSIAASSFCHQMVRSIVLTLVDVGRGKLEVADAGGLLAARDRLAGSGAAPARGLTLVAVEY